jgi:hypothetical protein
MPEKSQAAATMPEITAVNEPIASSNTAASSGWSAKYSKEPVLKIRGNAGSPGADRGQQIAPALPHHGTGDKSRRRTRRAWPAAKRRADWRQFEAAVRILGEDTGAREQPQHAAERPRVGSRLGGERLGRLRALGEQIGDTEVRSHVERLGDVVFRDAA